MNELINYLIARLTTRPVTAEALLIVAMLAVSFSVALYLETNPKAIAVLHNYYLQATAIIVLSIWVASLCWRYTKLRTLRIFATFLFIVIGIAGTTWVIRSAQIEQLKIRIVFDESVDMSPEVMAKLIDLLQSELFRVEISERALPIKTSIEERMIDNEVRTALLAHKLLSLQNEPNKPLPILITGKVLEGSDWSNLLRISWDDAAVISIWNVGSMASLSDVRVRRYVATSVAIGTLVSYALKRKKTILEDRPPELYKGCLHDFHRTRQTYVLQSQNPVLCEAEAKAIKEIFGGATVKALKYIFNQIAKDG